MDFHESILISEGKLPCHFPIQVSSKSCMLCARSGQQLYFLQLVLQPSEDFCCYLFSKFLKKICVVSLGTRLGTIMGLNMSFDYTL